MMNSFFDKMGEKLMPFASKVSANRYLNAIKEGFFGVMPVIIGVCQEKCVSNLNITKK